MRRFLVLTAVLACTACDTAPSSATQASAQQIQTISNVAPQPATLNPPPVLEDEAPPPKPKTAAWETPTPIVFSPEDEKLRAALPFTPAIAMDPIDGSKVSIRAATPTFEYKGKIFYFSSAGNRAVFASDPEKYSKGAYTHL